MSQFSLKSGWHPKGKDGGRESWRGDFKGMNQVAGWVGKGKTSAGPEAENTHIARPLAALKDPSSFGPPPKNVNYHGGAALPNEITPHRNGLGAPLTQDQIESAHHELVAQEEVSDKPAPPPLPYRADRTGLATENLPPPPIHHDIAASSRATPPLPPSRATPSLPPRLPSRQNTDAAAYSASPPPAYDAQPTIERATPLLNQSAISRLGNAGVSVPALGIGKSNGDSVAPNTKSQKVGPSQGSSPGLSELQSRFQRMNTSKAAEATTSNDIQTQPKPPSWQQTQQSLNTAQNFQKDPSSVTLADAQAAAQTGQSAYMSGQAFREKHADKFDAAEKKASTFNKKYNVTGRLNKFLEDSNEPRLQDGHPQAVGPAGAHQSPQNLPGLGPGTSGSYQRESPQPPVAAPHESHGLGTVNDHISSAQQNTASPIGRKAPPPPPPKKPSKLQAPPPVPLGTRPTFQ